MADAEILGDLAADLPPKRRIWRKLGYGLLALILALGLYAWTQRNDIASNAIEGELRKLGLEATYDVVSIGPERQVLANIVVGDPDRPDLTIERAVVGIEPRFGFPRISSITLVRPRIYGSYNEGSLRFGALDPLLFGEGEEPFQFPDYVLNVVDARGLIESDVGDIGMKLEGSGHMQSGFKGTLAAIAPQVEASGCTAQRATLYGTLSIDAERPRFEGPVRLAQLRCDGGPALNDATVTLALRANRTLDALAGTYDLALARAQYSDAQLARLAGEGEVSWSAQRLVATYDVSSGPFRSGQVTLGEAAIEGDLRATGDWRQVEVTADFSGKDLSPGNVSDGVLADAQAAAQDTLAAPLLARLRGALQNETRGSSVAGQATWRKIGDVANLVLPSLRVTGRSGSRLLDVSRLRYTSRPGMLPQIAGNFITDGRDMPRVSGRFEQRGGDTLLNLVMAEYAAGDSRLAVPRLRVAMGQNGSARFAGQILASGALPGGSVRGLQAPLDGTYSSAGGLRLWDSCTEIGFAALTYANLSLDQRRLTLCPPRGGAIVRNDAGGLRIAAGAPSLALTGRLGSTPIAIRSGAIGFAYPGAMSARAVQVTLGQTGRDVQFLMTNLRADLGRDISGSFDGSEIRLAAVPLDILDARGDWRYAGGVFSLSNGNFRLEDRDDPDRFKPLFAEGATVSLADNVIRAEADLHEPRNMLQVVRTQIVHSLSTGAGGADLFVDGLLFDENLQPDDLTRLALGIVANVEGTVDGSGRIAWSSAGDVTSTGRFRTADMDLAAPFGPAQGISGEIVFTDLLGLTTAADQRLTIRSVNPGIEVFDGVVSYQMTDGELLRVNSGRWPFLGGTLTLEPVTLALGVEETRRYTLVIEGMEAARFIEQLELGNLSATGTFDGKMPLVFTGSDGRIEGGRLQSRPPGGNLSYIGELTYENLGTYGNLAFNSLRSLDFRQMDVGIDGPLTGELVTRVKFDGVRQGAGTTSNILTRQIAKLPIQFNINIRAPFYKLITSIRSMYDPEFVRDPRELGLIAEDGRLPDRDGVTFEEAEERADQLEAEETAKQQAETETE
ncbi:YdbH domain-containing protein [Altererythrobacter sp. CAU 1778]